MVTSQSVNRDFLSIERQTGISHSDSGGFPVYGFLSHPLGSQSCEEWGASLADAMMKLQEA